MVEADAAADREARTAAQAQPAGQSSTAGGLPSTDDIKGSIRDNSFARVMEAFNASHYYQKDLSEPDVLEL